MDKDARMAKLAQERAQARAPRPTWSERAMVYFMLFVPGVFGGIYLADSAMPIRVTASLIWFIGFIYSFYWVQSRMQAHDRAFDEELRKLSVRGRQS